MPILKRALFDNRPNITPTPKQEALLSQFKDDITSGKNKYIFNRCVCGSSNERTVNEKDRLGLFYRYVICLDCGLIRANPTMDDETTTHFYQKYYQTLYHTIAFDDDNEDDIEKEFKGASNYSENYLKPFLNLPKETKITMIGCGSGSKLYPFHKEGYDCLGVDFSEEKINFGKTQGLNLRAGNYREILPKERKANIIILDGVIEHFINLKAEMKLMHDFLEEGGEIVVGVPDVLKAHRYYGGDLQKEMIYCHNYWFTLDSLIGTLKRVGFSFHGKATHLGLPHYLMAVFKKEKKDGENLNKNQELARKTIRYIRNAERFYKIRTKLRLDVVKRLLFR